MQRAAGHEDALDEAGVHLRIESRAGVRDIFQVSVAFHDYECPDAPRGKVEHSLRDVLRHGLVLFRVVVGQQPLQACRRAEALKSPAQLRLEYHGNGDQKTRQYRSLYQEVEGGQAYPAELEQSSQGDGSDEQDCQPAQHRDSPRASHDAEQPVEHSRNGEHVEQGDERADLVQAVEHLGHAKEAPWLTY